MREEIIVARFSWSYMDGAAAVDNEERPDSSEPSESDSWLESLDAFDKESAFDSNKFEPSLEPTISSMGETAEEVEEEMKESMSKRRSEY